MRPDAYQFVLVILFLTKPLGAMPPLYPYEYPSCLEKLSSTLVLSGQELEKRIAEGLKDFSPTDTRTPFRRVFLGDLIDKSAAKSLVENFFAQMPVHAAAHWGKNQSWPNLLRSSFYAVRLEPYFPSQIETFGGFRSWHKMPEWQPITQAALPLWNLGAVIARSVRRSVVGAENRKLQVLQRLKPSGVIDTHQAPHRHPEALVVANIQILEGAAGVFIDGEAGPEPWGSLTVFQGTVNHWVPSDRAARAAIVSFVSKESEFEGDSGVRSLEF